MPVFEDCDWVTVTVPFAGATPTLPAGVYCGNVHSTSPLMVDLVGFAYYDMTHPVDPTWLAHRTCEYPEGPILAKVPFSRVPRRSE